MAPLSLFPIFGDSVEQAGPRKSRIKHLVMCIFVQMCLCLPTRHMMEGELIRVVSSSGETNRNRYEGKW